MPIEYSSADGNIALVGAAGSFAIFQVATGKELASFKADDLGVALSPNNKVIAAARPDRLRLVEVASGKSIGRLRSFSCSFGTAK